MSEGGYVLGFGCERGVGCEAVLQGVRSFLDENGVSYDRLRTIASLDLKRDEEGLIRAAERLGVRLEFYSAEQLRAVEDIPNPNPVVESCVGTPGVAEPAARLAAASDDLQAPKKVLRCGSRAITLALAHHAPSD